MMRNSAFVAMCCVGLILCGGAAHALVYCNITDVKVGVLTNGTQITITADGVLDYENADESWARRRWEAKTLRLLFPGARSKVGKNFIDVSKFPVSYVQISVSPEAQEGVGLLISVTAMTRTEFEISRSADTQTVIITVASSRTLEAQGAADAEGAEGSKVLEITAENGLASIYAVNADVHETFARLARELDLDVAVDDGVSRTVSAYLTDLPPDEMLRSVARAAGLAVMQTDEGTYMVGEGVVSDLATYRLTETRSFRLRNLEASEAAQLLPTFIFPYLHQNSPQNAVVVTAQRDMLDKIEKDLGAIDKAPPQIMIEVLAVEFQDSRDVERVLNVSYNDLTNNGGYDGATGDLNYSTVGFLPQDFFANLRWLETKGRAEIRAKPRMAVLNGNWARIFIGTTRFIEVEVTQFGGTTKRIQGVNVGVSLGIRPWTGAAGEITTSITPKVSSIAELDAQTGLPVLSTRDASTEVRTKDGETIVIGGLTLEQEQVVEQKTPILGDIPLIGKLFRRRGTQKTTSELMIFVTPRLLDASGRLPDEAEEQDIRDRFLSPEGGWQEPRSIRITADDLRSGRAERSETE